MNVVSVRLAKPAFPVEKQNKQKVMDHSEFKDEDDEFLKSLRLLRDNLENNPEPESNDAKIGQIAKSPFRPSRSLARSPTSAIDPEAAKLNAENLLLSSKVEKLTKEVTTAKALALKLKSRYGVQNGLTPHSPHQP